MVRLISHTRTTAGRSSGRGAYRIEARSGQIGELEHSYRNVVGRFLSTRDLGGGGLREHRWAIGAPFAFSAGGDQANWMVGLRSWLLFEQNMPCDAPHRALSPLCSNARYLYEWAVALFVTAIVTFNLRGRCSLGSLIALAAFVSGCAFPNHALLPSPSKNAHHHSSFVLPGWLRSGIYPVAVHWIWSEEGLLSAFYYSGNSWGNYQHGVMDLGGSGVIHVLAGACALCAVAFVRRTDTVPQTDADAPDVHEPCCAGPDLQQSEGGDADGTALERVLESNFHPTLELATLSLWIGWFGLTVGGVYAQTGNAESAARAAVHTFLAGAGGGFSTLVAGLPALNLNTSALSQHSDRNDIVCCGTVRLISTGVTAGLVAVSAGAGTYTPYAAAIIGAAGGFLASLLEMGTIFVPPRFPKVRIS